MSNVSVFEDEKLRAMQMEALGFSRREHIICDGKESTPTPRLPGWQAGISVTALQDSRLQNWNNAFHDLELDLGIGLNNLEDVGSGIGQSHRRNLQQQLEANDVMKQRVASIQSGSHALPKSQRSEQSLNERHTIIRSNNLTYRDINPSIAYIKAKKAVVRPRVAKSTPQTSGKHHMYGKSGHRTACSLDALHVNAHVTNNEAQSNPWTDSPCTPTACTADPQTNQRLEQFLVDLKQKLPKDTITVIETAAVDILGYSPENAVAGHSSFKYVKKIFSPHWRCEARSCQKAFLSRALWERHFSVVHEDLIAEKELTRECKDIVQRR